MKLLEHLSNSITPFVSVPYKAKHYLFGLECPHGIYYARVKDLKSDTLNNAKSELLKEAKLSACSSWVEMKCERYNL
jgi:hypothetical protein